MASTGVFAIRNQMNSIREAPGKTWFWELAEAVIDTDRCIKCGACVAACPTDSLAVSEKDLPVLVKMCTGCSLCWDFCPRGGLRYEATWPKSDLAQIESDESQVDLGLEQFRIAAKVKVSSRPDSTRSSQDGGVVTEICATLLEEGEIDGVVIAREDPLHPWKGIPFLATSPSQVYESSGSFYNQTMALGAIDLAFAGLPPDARIALVGTPCEIQALKALQSRPWRRGRQNVDNVVLTIALLCTKNFDYERLMVEAIRDERGINLQDIKKVDVLHGRLIVSSKNDEVLVDEPVKDFHDASLKGCNECADFLGRAADISVGSVGSADGFSSVVVRTPIGMKAFESIRSKIEITEVDNPGALVKLDQLDKKIALKSLKRPFDPEGKLFISFKEHVESYGKLAPSSVPVITQVEMPTTRKNEESLV